MTRTSVIDGFLYFKRNIEEHCGNIGRFIAGVMAHGAIASGIVKAKYEVGANDVVSAPKL